MQRDAPGVQRKNLTNLFPIQRCVRNMKSICMCTCLFFVFWGLTNGNRSSLKLHPNEDTLKLRYFFFPRYFGVSSGQIKTKSQFWTLIVSLRKCKHQSLKRKPGWNARLVLRKHQVLCLEKHDLSCKCALETGIQLNSQNYLICQISAFLMIKGKQVYISVPQTELSIFK